MEGTEAGRVPRTIEVELTEDNVDSCVPGDVVTICGQVKVACNTKLFCLSYILATTKARGKQGGAMYICYIDANSLGTPKQGDTGKLDLLQFSLPEINGIQKIVSSKDIFGLIVKSICPSIYGNHLVKAGLALAMFRY